MPHLQFANENELKAAKYSQVQVLHCETKSDANLSRNEKKYSIDIDIQVNFARGGMILGGRKEEQVKKVDERKRKKRKEKKHKEKG